MYFFAIFFSPFKRTKARITTEIMRQRLIYGLDSVNT
jgi:hypothetical protein